MKDVKFYVKPHEVFDDSDGTMKIVRKTHLILDKEQYSTMSEYVKQHKLKTKLPCRTKAFEIETDCEVDFMVELTSDENTTLVNVKCIGDLLDCETGDLLREDFSGQFKGNIAFGFYEFDFTTTKGEKVKGFTITNLDTLLTEYYHKVGAFDDILNLGTEQRKLLDL